MDRDSLSRRVRVTDRAQLAPDVRLMNWLDLGYFDVFLAGYVPSWTRLKIWARELTRYELGEFSGVAEGTVT